MSGSDSSSVSSSSSDSSVTLSSAALTLGQQTLQTLKTAGDFIPIPGIGAAAGIALAILDIAESVRSNKAAFKDIGKDACSIVKTVIERVDPSKHPGGYHDITMLQRDAEQLVACMKAIKKCMKKHKQPSLMKRIVEHQSYEETIEECRDQLRDILTAGIPPSSFRLMTPSLELQARIKMHQMLISLIGRMDQHLYTSQALQMSQAPSQPLAYTSETTPNKGESSERRETSPS